MNILQKIFTNHYEDIKYSLHPRNTEIAENLSQVEFSLIFGFPENEEWLLYTGRLVYNHSVN